MGYGVAAGLGAGVLMAVLAILSGNASVLYTFYPPMTATVWFYIGLVLVVASSWIWCGIMIAAMAQWKRAYPGQAVPLAMFATVANADGAGTTYIGRAPVFDRRLDVAGYQLIVDRLGDEAPNSVDASRELLTRALLEGEDGRPGLNSLVTVKHNVSKAWANIDVLLKQRHDEIPKLVEVCKQYRQFERYQMLQILDSHWREHLAALDHLRQGIHLRGYAQKNPKQEYKREAFELFGTMIEAVKLEVIRTLTAVQIRTKDDMRPDDQAHVENIQPQHPSLAGGMEEPEPDYAGGDIALADAATKRKAQPVVRHAQKVGRNDPCPCGSGKKYKHCHGKLS